MISSCLADSSPQVRGTLITLISRLALTEGGSSHFPWNGVEDGFLGLLGRRLIWCCHCYPLKLVSDEEMVDDKSQGSELKETPFCNYHNEVLWSEKRLLPNG